MLYALLSLVVVGSVLAVGAVHLPVLLAVTGLSVAMLPLVRVPAATWPLPVTVALALAAYSALQAVPLPMRMLELVAPRNAAVWAGALRPQGLSAPSWASISLDPGASLTGSLRWTVYATVFLAAASVASNRRGRWGLFVVFAAALLAALATLGHGLLGADKVFGLYQPEFQAAAWHIGPLLNPNNLAGYLNLGIFCGLGFLMARRSRIPPWLVGLGIACILGVMVTSASRAGILALPVGLLAMGVVLARRGRHSTRGTRTGRWLVVAAVLGGTLLGVLAATSHTWREAWDKNLDKLALLPLVLPMLRDHAWLGIGPGAFESVFQAYDANPGHVVYSHAENFLADWAAAWGLPVTATAVLALAWFFNPRRLRIARDTVAVAGWAGVVALLLQNLADLALEVPAVSIAASTILGSIWASSQESEQDTPSGPGGVPPTRRTRSASTVVLFLLPAAVASAIWGRYPVQRDRRLIYEAYTESLAQPQRRVALREHLTTAMKRHPAEPYFPLIGALVASQTQGENPLPWLNRTLERDLRNPRAHLLLADVMAARSATSQAVLELRLAVTDEPDLQSPAATRAVGWTRDCDQLLRAAPVGAAGAPMLATMSSQLTGPKAIQGCSERLLSEALERAPRLSWPRQVAAGVLLQALNTADANDSGQCAGTRKPDCVRQFEDHLRVLEAEDADAWVPLSLRTSLLMTEKRPHDAERLLAERCYTLQQHRAECLNLRVRAAAATDGEHLGQAVKDYLIVACHTAAACANASTIVGGLYQSRSEWSIAVTHLERAAREEPSVERWVDLASAAAQAKQSARALDALERAARLAGKPDPALQQRIDALKQSLVHE